MRSSRPCGLCVQSCVGFQACGLRSWGDLQEQFADEPSQSLSSADRLVAEVMRERGYPMDEFDQRVADISVDQAQVVENNCAGHRIFLADANV
jgi:hypothetical protein